MNVPSRRVGLIQAAGALAVVAAVAACGADAAPATGAPTPTPAVRSGSIADVTTFKGGNGRLNVMPGPGPAGAPNLVWDVPLPEASYGEPIVVNGTVIVVTRGGLLVGIDAVTGHQAWDPVTLAAPVRSNPAVGGDTLYLITDDGILRAISLRDRMERWHASGMFLPEARVAVTDGLVIAGGPGELAAVRATDGHEVWRLQAPASMRLAVDGGFAYTSGDRSQFMTVMDVAGGTVVRTDEIGGADVLTPGVDAGGVVVGHREDGAGAENGVVALKPDGTVGWKHPTSKASRLETVTVAGDDIVLVTDVPLAAEVVNRSTGDREWLWEEEGGADAGEMLGGGSVADGVLYLVGATKGLTAIDIKTHQKLWSAPLEAARRDTRLVVTGGLVIATIPADNGTGRVVALADPADPRFREVRTPSSATSKPLPSTTSTPPPFPSASKVAFFTILDGGTPLEGESFPMATALAPDGTLYVVDSVNSRILVRSADGTGTWWEGYATKEGEFKFNDPGVAVSPDGSSIVVSEVGNHRLLLFDGQREFIRSVGRLGSGPEQFVAPGVTIDSKNRIWVVDGSNDNIQLFDRDGTYVKTLAAPETGRLRGPGGAAYREETGELYVADFGNDRVSVWNEDGWVRNYESRPEEHLWFEQVNNVEVDAAGRMFVVDTSNRIFILDPDGHLVETIPSVLPDGVDAVDVPGFSLDENGRIFMTDVGQRRIIVLQLLPPIWPPPA